MIDTRVIPDVASPGKWVAQYYDETTEVWFDIGDPKDSEQAARAAAIAYGSEKTRYVISADGTMIPAVDARVIELDETLARHLLDELDDGDRASYAFQHGQEI